MIRTRNGIAAGELATLELVRGARVGLLVERVIHRDGTTYAYARVTTRSAHGYRQGERITVRDSAFLERRPRAGEPPNTIIRDAMASPGRSFVWYDTYGAGWTRWDRPPGNAQFWIVDGPR